METITEVKKVVNKKNNNYGFNCESNEIDTPSIKLNHYYFLNCQYKKLFYKLIKKINLEKYNIDLKISDSDIVITMYNKTCQGFSYDNEYANYKIIYTFVNEKNIDNLELTYRISNIFTYNITEEEVKYFNIFKKIILNTINKIRR